MFLSAPPPLPVTVVSLPGRRCGRLLLDLTLHPPIGQSPQRERTGSVFLRHCHRLTTRLPHTHTSWPGVACIAATTDACNTYASYWAAGATTPMTLTLAPFRHPVWCVATIHPTRCPHLQRCPCPAACSTVPWRRARLTRSPPQPPTRWHDALPTNRIGTILVATPSQSSAKPMTTK